MQVLLIGPSCSFETASVKRHPLRLQSVFLTLIPSKNPMDLNRLVSGTSASKTLEVHQQLTLQLRNTSSGGGNSDSKIVRDMYEDFDESF